MSRTNNGTLSGVTPVHQARCKCFKSTRNSERVSPILIRRYPGFSPSWFSKYKYLLSRDHAGAVMIPETVIHGDHFCASTSYRTIFVLSVEMPTMYLPSGDQRGA